MRIIKNIRGIILLKDTEEKATHYFTDILSHMVCEEPIPMSRGIESAKISSISVYQVVVSINRHCDITMNDFFFFG